MIIIIFSYQGRGCGLKVSKYKFRLHKIWLSFSLKIMTIMSQLFLTQCACYQVLSVWWPLFNWHLNSFLILVTLFGIFFPELISYRSISIFNSHSGAVGRANVVIKLPKIRKCYVVVM